MTKRAHGSRACYVHGPGPGSGEGCRCEPCKIANRQQRQADNKRTAPPYVDAGRARKHVLALVKAGFSLKAQARAAGVSVSSVGKLVYGDNTRGTPPSKRVRPETEKALLGLTIADAPDSSVVIPAEHYTATLDELHRRGWTYTQMAHAIGTSLNNLKPRSAKVTAGRHRAARALLDLPVPLADNNLGHNAAARRRADAFDPEAERRDKLRKAAQAAERKMYRDRANDELPTLDLAELASQEWRRKAACRFVPDDQVWIFQAPDTDRAAMAACRKVCASCRVADDCLAEALRAGECGFWGGRSESERRAMKGAAA